MTQKADTIADTSHLDAICEKAIAGVPILPDEALALYRGLDLPSLGLVANAIRKRINPGDKVTYIIDRNVNPTNVCITDCGFCAFYRRPGDPEAYVLSREELVAKVQETADLGGRQILMQGGHHPRLKTDWWCDLIADLTEMQRLAVNANHLQLMIDPDGREICSVRSWTQAHENVKANGLNMEGWLGKILREDNDVRTRRACIYGMFYFNDPHKIIQLISNLPGEPLRDLREAGFELALRYMRVHYKKSSPQNLKFPDNGIVVPKYEFNPLPFFLLLDQKQTIDQRQGLWFLTEILKIRRDLGRIYFEELQDNHTLRHSNVFFNDEVEVLS